MAVSRYRGRLQGLPLLLCLASLSAAFLLDDSGDETLADALQAIRQLQARLDAVSADNARMQQQLAQHDQNLSGVQSTIEKIGSRVSKEYIYYDDGWILAFRATAGIGQSVYAAWTQHGHHDDDPLIRATLPCGCTTVNGSLPCDRHYRSRLLDSWPSAAIDQVKLVLYEDGEAKEHLTFTGTGSDVMSWFSQARLVESSWTDLKAAKSPLFFSIEGEKPNERRFYIELAHGGCPKDVGWLTVKDKTGDVCTWAKVNQAPAFLYAPSTHDTHWDQAGTRHADVMAVFVKLRESASSKEQCI